MAVIVPVVTALALFVPASGTWILLKADFHIVPVHSD